MNAAVPRTSTAAVVSLVFGIVAWVALPVIGALIAIVTGHAARSDIRHAPAGSVEGSGMALSGLVLGYLQMILVLLFIAVVFLFFGGLPLYALIDGH